MKKLIYRIAAQLRGIPEDELTTAEQNIVAMLRYANYLPSRPLSEGTNTADVDPQYNTTIWNH